jgi:hypothetical protein
MKLISRLKYYINPKRWMSWMRGQIIGSDLKQEYMEQFMYRYTHPNCKICVKNGRCVEPCKCHTYKKMLDPYAECDGKDENGNPHWGRMVSKKVWNEYKDFVGLEFYNIKTKVVGNDKGENK